MACRGTGNEIPLARAARPMMSCEWWERGTARGGTRGAAPRAAGAAGPRCVGRCGCACRRMARLLVAPPSAPPLLLLLAPLALLLALLAPTGNTTANENGGDGACRWNRFVGRTDSEWPLQWMSGRTVFTRASDEPHQVCLLLHGAAWRHSTPLETVRRGPLSASMGPWSATLCRSAEQTDEQMRDKVAWLSASSMKHYCCLSASNMKQKILYCQRRHCAVPPEINQLYTLHGYAACSRDSLMSSIATNIHDDNTHKMR